MKINKNVDLFLFFLIFSQQLFSQLLSIKVLVHDKYTNKIILMPVFIIKEKNCFMKEVDKGIYEIAIPEKDSLRITISAKGYRELDTIVKVKHDDKLKFFLEPAGGLLKEYYLTGMDVFGKQVKEINIPVYKIKLDRIENAPILAEPDIFRVLQTYPSVSRSSDLSASLNIRGSTHYQNLILLDDIPVFNSFHLGGYTSIFNTDILGGADFFPSSYPPEFGGVASSVLNLKSKNRFSDNHNFSGSLGLMASKINYNGKIGNGGLFLSGRRTYFDILSKIFNSDYPYYFYDLFGKYIYVKRHLYSPPQNQLYSPPKIMI